MTQFIGMINQFQQYQAGNNYWHRGMNENLIKMAMTVSSSVLTMVDEMPVSGGAEGDMYISGPYIYMWLSGFDDDGTPTPAQWWQAQANIGTVFFVQDEQAYYIFSDDGGWEKTIDLNSTLTPVPRTTTFYNPGNIRPGAVIFKYVAGLQYAIPEDAPGSGAGLETAPGGGGISFAIKHGGVQVGSIDFAQDALSGTFDFPARVVVNNALPNESKYEQAQELTIVAPADLRGATGLNVTIQAEIWERD
jgi:hypothetical protein